MLLDVRKDVDEIELEKRRKEGKRSARAQLLRRSFLPQTHDVSSSILFSHGYRNLERLQTQSAAVERQALEGMLTDKQTREGRVRREEGRGEEEAHRRTHPL